MGWAPGPVILALCIAACATSGASALLVENGQQFLDEMRSLAPGSSNFSLSGLINVTSANLFSKPLEAPGFISRGEVKLSGDGEKPAIVDLGNHFELTVRTFGCSKGMGLGRGKTEGDHGQRRWLHCKHGNHDPAWAQRRLRACWR